MIIVTVAVIVLAAAALMTTHYEVNVEIEGEGTVEPTHASVNIMGSAEFKITPADGWIVSSVLVDGSPVEIDNGILKLSDISGNHKVRVIFTPTGTYQLETSSEGNGSVYTAAKSYAEGDNAAVEITPDEGYVISDVLIDGKSVGSVNHLDIKMNSGHSVNVKFREATAEDPTVDVSVDVKVGTSTGAFYGTVTPSGSVRVAYGGTLIVSVSLNEGYLLRSVTVDGKDVGTSPMITVKDIVKNVDMDITVVSEKLKSFTITSSSSAGGSVSPSSVTVDEGDSVTFTIIPDTGYRLSSLVIDGVSESYTGSTYTFTKVSSNHTISAVFEVETPVPPTPTLESISLEGEPTEVTVNQIIDTSKMVVTAHWSDKTTSQVTGYTVSPTSFATAGESKVTVTYEGKTASFTVNVKEVEFTVTFKADTGGKVSQTSVTVIKGTVPVESGDSLVFGDMTVTPSAISKDYLFGSWIRTDGSAVTGQIAGNVTFTATFLTLTGISVVEQPTKTAYIDEESFESAGVKVEASYGTKTADVTSDCTFTPEKLTLSDTSVTVKFQNKTASIPVKVNVRYYTVKFIASEGGTVAPEVAGIVKGTATEVSDNVLTFNATTVTAKANSGYIFGSWTRSSGSLTDKITSDVTFTASFLKLDSISITTQPSKTTYVVGEKFDKTGMKVTASYVSGAKTVEVSDYTFSPDGALTLDNDTITITYQEKTATVKITVEKAKYTVTFEATEGGSVSEKSVIVTDGDKPTVSENNLTFGSKTVTPTADSKSSIFGSWSRSDNLDIDAAITSNVKFTATFLLLTEITVAQQPDKAVYIDEDDFDKTGAKIEAKYVSGSVEEKVDVTSDCTFAPEQLTLGVKSVTVTFMGKTVSIPVTVNERYYTVTITASDGGKVSSATESIVKGTVPSVSENVLTLGTTEVTATAESKYIFGSWTRSSGSLTDKITSNVTFTASFLKLDGISITTQPTKTAYIVGEKFDKTGMKVTATYSAGSETKTVEVSDYEISPSGELALTDKQITVTYLEKTATVDITVEKAKYTVTFAKSGDGTVSKASLTVVDGDKLTVSGDSLTYGTDTVTPTASDGYVFGSWSRSDNLGIGAAITSDVTITAKFLELTGITVKTNPDKMYYYVGESFDSAGTAIQAVYSDGTETKNVNITVSECTFSYGKFTDAGQKVTVKYKEKTAEISVTVLSLSSIEITTAPSVTTFAKGATVDLTGMVVTAHYDVSAYDRDVTAYTSSPKSFDETGDKDITITYSEGSITKTVKQSVKIVTDIFSVKVTSYSGTKMVNGSATAFSETLDKNLKDFKFDLNGIVPGITQTVTLKITNDTTSDLKACVYVSSITGSTEFAKQMYLSSGETKKSVNDSANASFLELGTVKKGETTEITLTISFPHSADNNKVMGQSFEFSIVVFAEK